MAKKENTEKNILKEMDDFYENAKKDRELYEKDWYFNVAFFLGYQWISWNEYTRRIEEPKAPSWRVRITANQIAPICNQIIAKLTKNRPMPIIIPATSEDEDVNAARMGEKVLKYLSRVLKIQTKNQEMWLWGVITGTSFKIPYWDKDAKQVIDTKNKIHLGEVGIDIASCFEIYPEVGATSERLTQAMICRTYPLDYIREKWDEEVEDEGVSGKTPVEERLYDIMKKSAPGYTPPPSKKQEKSGNAIVKEYRQLPNKENPNGRRIFVANNVLLNPDDMNLPHKFLIKERKLGIIKYDHEKIPGRFWGKGRPEDLIPLQKEYNKCVDTLTEALTPNGWKKYDELLIGNKILTYNKEQDICEWGELEDVFIKKYQGFLNVLESNQISSRTTSGHTFIVKHRINKNLLVTKEPNGEHSIPLIRPVKNSNLDNEMYSDEFIKLVGYAITEGQYVKPREEINKYTGEKRYSNKIAISQSISKHPEIVKDIQNQLDNSGSKYGRAVNEKTQVVSYNLSAELGKQIKAVAPDKLPSFSFINYLSERQLKILLDGIMAGDGMLRIATSGEPRFNFYSSDLKLAERVQYIGILLGENPKIKVYEAKSEWHRKPNQYVVTFKIERFKEYASVQRAIKEPVYYSGTIWCPTVKNGFWLSRRDGKINITGNTRSQIIEIKNLMAKPKWFVPIGSGIKKTHLTSEPGEIVYYNPGVPKPEQGQLASLPAYVIKEPEMTRRDMQDVSGIHEVSKAQVPTGVRSGLAIQYLQEQDDTRLGPIIARFEEAESECWNYVLSIVKENYKELRLIRIIGRNGQVEAFDFKGSNISDNMDVIIQGGSAFPLNKVAKQQFIISLWQNKIIADPRIAMKMMEFGSYEELYEDFAIDEKNAQEENQMLSQGQSVAAKYYDNDDIHIYEHMRYAKSNKFTPEIEQFIGNHIDEHSERKAQMLQAMPSPEEMGGKPTLSGKQQAQLTPKKPEGASLGAR